MKTGKITTLLLILITISGSLSAQEKELFINYKYNRKGGGLLAREYSTREHGNIEVFSYGNKMISRKLSHYTNAEIRDNRIVSCDTNYFYVAMDFNKKELLLSSFLPADKNRYFLLKEPLNLFEWKPCMDTKTILGYTCHKATCKFRGRNYEAWFTRAIPFKAAPWKFHGLPGVILEVYSTDEYCSWVAESIEIRPFKKEIELPFYGIDIVDLKKYIKILKAKKQSSIESQKRRGKSEEQISMSTRTIEKFDLD
ncbi:GLPGLI family protein [Marinifilum sp.]|uniref:GLPGLI family protein n=1 Tax=Marinifilum sp. TaxID=2033137 RepID=UPI003BACAE0F